MKKLLSALCVLCAMVAQAASAGTISDSGTNAYWGGDDHGKGDLIGDSTYDIMGATITRVGSILTIVISTNFAGKAGADSGMTPGGIGYGDVFLSNVWNPYGSDAHHLSDNASNGTLWKWGLALDNRYSNTGGSFSLYSLNGSNNAANLDMSEQYMKCSGCTYRNGQAVAVDTKSSTVSKVSGVNGTWTVNDAANEIKFTMDIKSVSALMSYTNFAMHWGETCQNDVIEGITRVVPTPGSLPLLVIGLASLAFMRRREKFTFLRKS